MKAVFISFSIFLSGLSLFAQEDTLYVNATHNLALFFPNPIEQAVTGHQNYSFGYNKNTPMRLGLLQGHPGTDSNLMIVTEDGKVFSFYLAYRKQLQESHRIIKVDESIGSILTKKRLNSLHPKKRHFIITPSSMDSLQYRKGSAYFLKRNRGFLKTKRKDGMLLRLREVAYFGKQTYVVLEIENRSAVDFEVDFVQLFKEHGNPGKKSSYQKVGMNPLYKHQMPPVITVGQSHRFVYVLPKFTLGDTEKLQVELLEKRGSRRVVLLWR